MLRGGARGLDSARAGSYAAPIAAPRRTAPRTPRLVPRAKVWLEVDGEYAFGAGIARILQAVESTGTIKGAAERVGKSYRHVWARIKTVERTLGETLVETKVGGGDERRSRLTPRAAQLVREFLAFRQEILDRAGERFER